MKKSRILIVILLFACLVPIGAAVAAAGELEKVVSEELSYAKTPSASVAVIAGEDVEFVAYQGENSALMIDDSTLFQIGSLSKQFTGLGVLLLEDDGVLSLDDPVTAYLPWFSASYGGQAIAPDALTIAHCLYQTSGFTNDETQYPAAEVGMSLEDGVRLLSGRELAFPPGERFSYANANYRILGLLIEAVSGQSYDDFMAEQIFAPLGMESTYASPAQAQGTGKVVEGSRLSFLRAWPYTVPVAEGNVPAGYLYSNAKDMGRWLQIQLGDIEVSGQFQRILEKSHVANDMAHYAAGWYVRAETGALYHSGGTPNYSAYVEMRPASGTAVCILTNMNASANTDNLGAGILDVVDGQPARPRATDIWRIMDLLFTSVAGVCVVGIAVCIFLLLRRKKFTSRGIKAFILPTCLALLAIAVAVVMPIVFGSSWASLCFWGPISLPVGLLSLAALAVCAYLFSFVAVKHRTA